ncbi:MAG: hypothetical protein WCF85_20810, partial [Rhodospirillaceae bacterium]
MTESSSVPTVGRAETLRNRQIIAQLMARLNAGQKDAVMAECETLEAAEIDHPAALYGLAALAYEYGATKSAFDALIQAHQRDPNEALFAEMLAVLYARAGNPREGTYFAKLSASLGLDAAVMALLPPSLPSFTQALITIQDMPYLAKAEALVASERHRDAVTAYETHLAFFPGHAAATRGIARSLLTLNQPVQALAHLSEFSETGAVTATDLSLLGSAYAAIGNATAARDCHDEATAIDPEDAGIGCARLHDAIFDPDITGPALAGQSATWAATLPHRPRPPAVPVGDRPMRVGYLLSAVRDPRDIEVVAAALAVTDPRRVSRTIYGRGSIDDAINASLHFCYDKWRDISACDAATVAAIVKGDSTDVLVDAGGHAAPLHLAVLALRPAPYQVSWLGNPGSLGLVAGLDAELVDSHETEDAAAPAGGPRRLAPAAGLYCYDRAWPEARTVPAQADHFIFGADIRLPQLHPDLLGAWARLLERMPESRLALRDREFVDGNLLSWLVGRFEAAGIAGRVDIFTSDITTFYRQIDVALAPFVELNPHDTAAALRQGTPV